MSGVARSHTALAPDGRTRLPRLDMTACSHRASAASELQQDSTWIGVEDYAALRDVTPQTVRNWIRRGELKAHDSGHGYMINRNAKRQREVHR